MCTHVLSQWPSSSQKKEIGNKDKSEKMFGWPSAVQLLISFFVVFMSTGRSRAQWKKFRGAPAGQEEEGGENKILPRKIFILLCWWWWWGILMQVGHAGPSSSSSFPFFSSSRPPPSSWPGFGALNLFFLILILFPAQRNWDGPKIKEKQQLVAIERIGIWFTFQGGGV